MKFYFYFADVNRVKLVGTVLVGQFKDSRGNKLMKVKTTDYSGNNECVFVGSFQFWFCIYITKINQFSLINRQIHLIQSTSPHDYETGQRVFVNGRLSSKVTVTVKNKRLFKPIVHAIRVHALNSMTEDKTKLRDVNSVELLCSVATDISNEDNHSSIQAITHHRHKTLLENRRTSHEILAFDQNLSEFVRDNLEKSDRIYVRGFLSSGNIDVHRNKSLSGYIVAQNIQKIIKITGF